MHAQLYEDACASLEKVLEQKEHYEIERAQQIKRLSMRLHANGGSNDSLKFELYYQLFRGYQNFIYDSAFVYAKKMIDLGYELDDQSRVGFAKNKLGFILVSSGMYKETFDTLNTVDIAVLPDTSQVEYYALMARALYDLCDYNSDEFYCSTYVNKADAYIDRATELADVGSYSQLYLKGLQKLRTENSDAAIDQLNPLMNNKAALTKQQLAITSSTLSYLHLKMGDTAKAVSLLAEASIADIMSANKETRALTKLAELLYELGEVERAYKYINAAMDDAEFYGAKQRKSEVGSILPIIAAARLSHIDDQRKSLLGYSIGLSLLAMLTIFFAVRTFMQSKRLQAKDRLIQDKNDRLTKTNDHLLEANKIKEEYLGYYFHINSEYLDKIEKFKRSVNQKLVNQKFEEIRFVLNKINLKKEREELYLSFDKVFLKLFPDFVQRFNALFDQEHQILLEKDQLLNTELRIFALIRLGISDGDKLAMVLGYSVNTIYAYKNRVKSRSFIPNEAFEQKIMEIDVV